MIRPLKNVAIRKAHREDAPLLPPVERAAAQSFATIAELAFLAAAPVMSIASHEAAISNGLEWLADNGTSVTGFLAAQRYENDLYITELSVLPAFQRHGIGRALIAAAQSHAMEQNLRALTLTTFRDVAWNGPFYARLGFETLANPSAYLRTILQQEKQSGLAAMPRVAMARTVRS